MLKPLVVLTLTCAAGYVSAASSELAGVWTGTLGKARITACFNAAPDSNGSYYYQRFLSPIQLTRENADEPWIEDGNTGLWQLDTPQGDTLTGTWSKAPGGTALPLALTRSSAEGCGGDAYNAPMEAAALPVKVQKKTFNGHAYQVRTQGAQVTLKLEGNGSAIGKITQHLARLAASPEGQSEFFSERREFLGRNGSASTSEISVEPTYWSSGWITVRFYRWSAGYGSSGISWGLHSWNLQTGEAVDPWTWLGTRFEWYSPYSGHVTLPKAFATRLQSQATADADCPGVASYSSYDLSFDTQGMRLANRPSGDGCDVDETFTWKQLEPLLSAQGRAALPSLQVP
ncbi:hypothetical protein EXN22_13925 [Pseudomonas tructae]|uniref:Uncharacterized protein n=1 Tax=Pseudomonas tructae TaxID=2518644 RepID=A0A411MIW2_9PSED|nr:hypothetical protein [Pseudomonas tructae]QBF26741.1 hypothetical protein EXN22_13925 [Pseudomonas tructae]